MPHYVDGFVIPVLTDRLDEYRQLAERANRIWKEHGALQCWECASEDVPPGKLTSFPRAVLLREDETVLFSWIVFESREHRDAVNAKVMADPRYKELTRLNNLPYGVKRIFWGGFETILEL